MWREQRLKLVEKGLRQDNWQYRYKKSAQFLASVKLIGQSEQKLNRFITLLS